MNLRWTKGYRTKALTHQLLAWNPRPPSVGLRCYIMFFLYIYIIYIYVYIYIYRGKFFTSPTWQQTEIVWFKEAVLSIILHDVPQKSFPVSVEILTQRFPSSCLATRNSHNDNRRPTPPWPRRWPGSSHRCNARAFPRRKPGHSPERPRTLELHGFYDGFTWKERNITNINQQEWREHHQLCVWEWFQWDLM